MTKKNAHYQRPMLPWPELAGLGKQIKIEKPELGLFYFEAGETNAEILLLIHGLGDEADTWRHVILPLADNFHIYALDLPGFGRSEKPNIQYEPVFLSEVIIQFMDKLGIPTGILMGSSLGGILAHHLAIAHPERVKGLVLVGGSIFQPENIQDWSLKLMSLPIIGKWLYTRLRKDPDEAYATLKNFYYRLQELNEVDRSFLYTRVNQRVWDDGQRRAYLSTLRALAPWMKLSQADLPDQLRKLIIPTLVIRGEHDFLFSDLTAMSIVKTQPNASKATIQDAGHLPHQENPDAFLSVVEKWLLENF